MEELVCITLLTMATLTAYNLFLHPLIRLLLLNLGKFLVSSTLLSFAFHVKCTTLV